MSLSDLTAEAALAGFVFRMLTFAPISRSMDVMMRPMPELPPVEG